MQINRKQIKLDPDETEAWWRYYELMYKPLEQPVVKTGPAAFVVEVLDAFLDWTKNNREEKTYTWHRDHVRNFIDGIPKTLTVTDLNAIRPPAQGGACHLVSEHQDRIRSFHPARDEMGC